MAKIFISMSGEGRGHATRVRALVEALRGEHRITLFAPGDAFSFLWPLYTATEVGIQRLPGLRFAYDASGHVDYRGMLKNLCAYLKGLPSTVGWLSDQIRRERPDLVITDFEPSLPRAAKRCGVPFVSLNHQHFLRTYDLRSLPRRLRLHAAYMATMVGAYHSGQRETIVSSFYFPPLRPGCGQVTQVGVLLRPKVAEAEPRTGAHLVAYWRRRVSEQVLQALASTGLDVRVYGLGACHPRGKLSFHAVSEAQFVRDLAGCCALVCTAGNQLVGEALCLGKTVFALPEPNNYEQEINAHFLRQSGAGEAVGMSEFSPGHLHRFLSRLDEYRSCIDTRRMNGLPAALAVLRRHLPAGRAAVPAMPETLPAPELAAA